MLAVRRKRLRAMGLSGAVALLCGLAVVVPLPTAQAASDVLSASGSYNSTAGQRFLSSPVKDAATGGTYMLQTNLWNKAAVGGFDVNFDTTSTKWSLNNNSANSYFPAGNESTAMGSRPCSTTPGNAAFDDQDPGCHWAGHGEPWAPTIGAARDGFATTGGISPFVPQQPPAGTGTHIADPSSEFANQIHAPASYADIFLGCHWGNCSPGTTPFNAQGGAPFPLQYTGISRLDSVWNINVPNTGDYDAAYDIWLDSNTRNCPQLYTTCASPPNPAPVLPNTPRALNSPGQNDGAEIMIWVGQHGYNNANPGDTPVTYKNHAGTIQPAGYLFAVGVTLPGITIPGRPNPTFDVWAARSRSFDNGIRWNVITYVNRSPLYGTNYGLVTPGLTNGGFDSKAFVDHAVGLGALCSTDVNSPIAGDTQTCVDPHWWMTSVQAGYEIWDLPQGTGPNNTMTTNAFQVNPVAVSGGANTGNRACPAPGGCAPDAPPGTPLVNWFDTFNIQAQGCSNGADASWRIRATNYLDPAAPVANFFVPTATFGELTESPKGSGNYIASVGPLNNPSAGYVLHDVATVFVNMICTDPSGSATVKSTEATVFIDPSGEVLNIVTGQPVAGASVALSKGPGSAGPFTPVANGDATVMCGPTSVPACGPPFNTANPSTTDAMGRYHWDTVAGWYRLSATKAGCTQVAGSTSAPVNVQPPPANPVTGVILYLNCGGTPALSTQVVVRPPGVGPFGYCADITVTNNTSAPVEWNTSFPVPGGQRINQSWNMVLTQVGSTATNVHANPANPWNRILQPGQSTTSTGFCAVP